MKWTKKMKGAGKKAAVTVTALGMVLTAFPPIPAKAAEEFAGQLTSVESVEKGSKDNIVVVKFNGGVTAQLTFRCSPRRIPEGDLYHQKRDRGRFQIPYR